MNASMGDQVAAITKHFVAVEAITFVFFHSVVHVLNVNVQISRFVERLSAHLADFAFDLRVGAFVTLQLRSRLKSFVTKTANVIFYSLQEQSCGKRLLRLRKRKTHAMDFEMNFQVAGSAEEFRTKLAGIWSKNVNK